MEQTMKACLVDESNNLYWGDVEKPICKDDELLVRVHATAVNRADLHQKEGLYPVPPDASPILGLEMAGTVEQIGKDVSGWRVGDRVMALLSGGGYAQYAAIKADIAIEVPEELHLDQAASIPEVYLTSYLNMLQLGGLSSGERVLIHAAASGVGTASIQLAKAVGAKVYATAGSEEKIEVVKDLGAELAILYKEQSFREIILKETNGHGVELVMDPVGAAYWEDNMEVLALDGRMVLYGTMGGSKIDQVDLMPAMLKRIHLIASTLRGIPHERKVALKNDFVEWVMPKFRTGEIVPIIDSVYESFEVNEAHARMKSNQNIGKLVVRVPS
ncbi:NAD(P)H-quinone oxidoreductase [Paenibacillus aquistagni]|uniref:Putative NAD(P)H quinone oxidoreductase, PIG3 family n=1 Tax=Paenibacillus aquistagni TaxID=1852522 RepID=A0A1X7LBW4_9BACL|nr:NAD(P)H-quinone oxidoreductase [Paenibacillus aquistagni]SMG51245.1 putative NAD(P)H quinone oxidoreductase, PIG3 family [Paenibacillus aquistagni]